MTDAARTTYERATRSYDAAHQRQLLEAIATAIFETSRVTDANAVVLRSGEITDALATALASVLAMRPEARVPSQLRALTDEIGRKLRRDAERFRTDEEFRNLVAGWFDGNDVGGRA
jgi:hypothetical protein